QATGDGPPVRGAPYVTTASRCRARGIRSVPLRISLHSLHGRDEPSIDRMQLERLTVAIDAITAPPRQVRHVPRPAVLSFAIDRPMTDVDEARPPEIDQPAGIEVRVARTAVERVSGELGANLGRGERRSRWCRDRGCRLRAERTDGLGREH